MRYIKAILYAHGLGGSPGSAKAVLMEHYFGAQGIRVCSPSLAVPSFEKLSPLTACDAFGREMRALAREPMVVIASSFGAFIALHALRAIQREVVPHALVLLAPVIDPWSGKMALLTPQVEEQWRVQGSLPILDLTLHREVPVHYRFVEELQALGPWRDEIGVPTLIVHGRRDAVVSVEQSRACAAVQPCVTLVTVDDDHALLSQPSELVALIDEFVVRRERGLTG